MRAENRVVPRDWLMSESPFRIGLVVADALPICIAPNGSEWALSGPECLEAIAAELEGAGCESWVQAPRDGNYSHGGIVTDPLIDLSIFVWEQVRDETITLIVGATLEHVRRRVVARRRRDVTRRGVIYGPDGQVLREFDLDRDA